MGLEHFATGSGEGRGSSSEPITISMLGRTGTVLPKSPLTGDVTKNIEFAAEKMYQAEFQFRSRIPKETRLLNEDNTRELVHTAIHHPAMDEVPGIDELRKTFDASNTRHLGIKDNLGYTLGDDKDRNTLGIIVPKERHVLNGRVPLPKNLMRLARINDTLYPSVTPDHPAFGKINKITTTHETSHLMVGQQLYNVAHQWPMARLHLHLVNTLFGKKHGDALKDWYNRYDVDH